MQTKCSTYSDSFSGLIWQQTQLRYDYDQMTPGLKAWLYKNAVEITGSNSNANAILEGMERQSSFQDKIFLNIYTGNYSSKENLRSILASLCGSYSIANPVSDYIVEK